MFRKISAAMALALAGMVPASPASPMVGIDGRWSGWGTIMMESGSAEQVKCVATYVTKAPSVTTEGGIANGGSASLQQNLRCASQSFRIDAVANLNVKGDDVSGHWEERTYSAQGSVSGRLTGAGFNLSIQGPNLSAAMIVAISDCKQSITIVPRGFDISRIAISLAKC
ncbi:MAG: hypothetical protein C0465_27185 [Ralstonia sp.]|nr:hypothetical protein [Ralstonia sp.]